MCFRIINILCIICMIYLCSESTDAAAIKRPTGSSCNKQNTFFKHNAIYTYDYTITTSNGFVGASSSRSGAQLSCTVTLSVPRKCEIVMQVSDCTLKERELGQDATYRTIDNADAFLQDLQRFAMYFQMNKGLVIPDTIVADDEETLAVLNIKRGIISALQFQILDADEYTDDVEETDIFGFCHTKYSFSDKEQNMVHTFRNLRECEMSQVFLKQFNSPFAAIKPLLGGLQEGKIAERIYPFASEVTCDYQLNDQKRLAKADCLQVQYFKPSAYKGDVLATVMTNISQSLEMTKYQKKSQPNPDLSLNGRSVIDVRYTYSADLHSESSAAQIVDAATKLASSYDNAQNSDDYSVLPGIFEELVDSVRHATKSVLHQAMTEIFECRDGCDESTKETTRGVFLDAVKVCGTEACMLSFLHCINKGHVTMFNANHFVTSMTNMKDIPESVLAELHAYCKTSENSLCWLSLGTIFSHNYVEDEKEDSVLFAVQDEMSSRVINNCKSETLINTERELNTAIKLLNNIGVQQNLRYMKKRPDLNIAAELHSCLLNKAIPLSVRRSVLRSFKLVQEYRQYKDTPANTVDTLFTLLEDSSEDVSVRTQAFSQLIKTTVKEDILRLKTYVSASNTKQMKSYMTSAIRSLLEDDSPEMTEIKASWKAVRSEHYFYTSPFGREAYLPTMSKSINIGQFFKLPISDILGGQLLLDLVYEPSSSVFTSLSVGINYYQGNKIHNLFEVSFNLHGFELLFNVLMKKVDMTPQDLMKLYSQLKARAEGQSPFDDEIHFAKFQQNIVKAVEDILKVVNHPVGLDFDFSVDVIVQGQEVMFMSLQEVMEHIRQMQAKMPPNKSVVQGYLQKLMTGIPIHPYRFTEMVKINRGIPTCAGLPLNMTVSWSGKASSPISVKSNLAMFMAGKIGQLSAGFTQYINFAYDLSGMMVVPFGDVYTSGIKANIHMGHERGASVNVRYGYSDPMVLVENPTKRKIEFQLDPILPGKENEDLFYVTGRMSLIRGENEETVPIDPTVQTTVKQCSSDKVNMLVGRALCLHFEYPNVATSRTHPYFPLSGPFDLRLKLSKVDSVQSFTSSFEYAMEKETGKGYSYNLKFEHYGKGDRLSRYAFMNYAFKPSDKLLTIKAGFPEAKLSYEAEYDIFSGDVSGGVIQEWFKHNNHAVQGYLFKFMRDGKSGLRETLIHMNYTTSAIGWELFATDAGKAYNISYTYYCTIDLPFLYLFHPIPLLAAENGDKTQVRLYFKDNDIPTEDPGKMQKQRKVSFGIYDKQVTAVVIIDKQKKNADFHSKVSYFDGENEHKYVVEGKRSSEMSAAGLVMSYGATITSDDVNLNAKTLVTFSKGEIIIDGDVEYTNNEEENISRKKRSLRSIYKKFKEIAKSAKNKLENKLFGENVPKPFIEGSNQVIPADTELSDEVQENVPLPPSIWDLKQWNAKIYVSAVLRPIFPPGVAPGSVPPTEMEVYVSASAKHPWNGGYVEYTKNFKMGSNKKNTMANFKFWLDGDSVSAVNDLNGAPVIVNGEAAVVKRKGGFYIDRQIGKLFNYSMNYLSSDIDKVYSILFNWDAPGHHEPLIHVVSKLTWKSLPFFNHYYDEVFTYDTKHHIVHSNKFEHNMLNFSILTDLDFSGYRNTIVQQNGSVLLKVSNLVGSLKFENFIEKGKISTKLIFSSMPQRTLVYAFQIDEENKFFTFSSAIIPAPEADTVDLTTTKVELWGNSHFMVTTTWTPAYQEVMEHTLRNGVISNAQTLNNFAEIIRYNLVKPPILWSFPFFGRTPLHIFKNIFMSNIISTMQASDSIVANLCPVKKRENEENAKIATRTDALMHSMQEMERLEVGTPMLMMRKAVYLMLKSASKMLNVMNTVSGRDKKIESILQDHQYSYLIPTPFTFKRLIMLFPDVHEGQKQLFFSARSISYVDDVYERLKAIKKQETQKRSVASIFGLLGSDRYMNIEGFDGNHYRIAASNTRECTYLLAADVRQKRWSLILSPDGLTFMASPTTITVGWDKNIYLDNCKLPSYEVQEYIDYGSIRLTRTDYRTSLDTLYGIKIFCDNADDVCTVKMDLSYRNETIGLLGNGDHEIYNDKLLPDGHIAPTDYELLNGFVLSGPDKCYDKTSAAPEGQSDDLCNDAYKKCYSRFSEALGSQQLCYSYLGSRRWDFCKDQRCEDIETNSCYVFKALVADCEARGLISGEFNMEAVCPSPINSVAKFLTGYLDIVFVISWHSSMVVDRKIPQEYMLQLAGSGSWKSFDDVQVGMVGFGGEGNQYDPQVVHQESDNRFFYARSEMPLDKLKHVTYGAAPVNGFDAIKKAASYPFRQSSHKMIVLIMTQEQITGSGQSDNLANLKSDLHDRGIILNMVSDYKVLSGHRVIGLTSEGKVIKSKSGYHGNKDFPEDAYASLVSSTNGALWDLEQLSRAVPAKLDRIVEEFVSQVQANNNQVCRKS